jgi:hypothetical protein
MAKPILDYIAPDPPPKFSWRRVGIALFIIFLVVLALFRSGLF